MADEKPTPKPDTDKEGADVNIRLGADPSELDRAYNEIAYCQGYRRGMWDLAYGLMSFLIVLMIAQSLLRWALHEPK